MRSQHVRGSVVSIAWHFVHYLLDTVARVQVAGGGNLLPKFLKIHEYPIYTPILLNKSFKLWLVVALSLPQKKKIAKFLYSPPQEHQPPSLKSWIHHCLDTNEEHLSISQILESLKAFIGLAPHLNFHRQKGQPPISSTLEPVWYGLCIALRHNQKAINYF